MPLGLALGGMVRVRGHRMGLQIHGRQGQEMGGMAVKGYGGKAW